jgi:MraZ protein
MILPALKGVGDAVSDRELFSGYGLSPIDAKGRVALPPDLRLTIDANSAERILILTQHDSDPCLIGYDRGWANLLAAEIERDEALERAAGRTFDRHNSRRRAFAITERLPFDTSGRFVLNGFLREDMKLTNFAFFAGVGNIFEVWNPQTLLNAVQVDDRIKRACRWHMSQKGLA